MATSRLMPSEWKELVEQALRYREDFGQSVRWPTFRDYYRGLFPAYTRNTDSILPYNIVYGMARSIIPNIYYRNPYFMLSPRQGLRHDPNIEVACKVKEAVANWLVQEMGLKSAMRRGLLHAFLCGRGLWKVGYDSQYGWDGKHSLLHLGVSDTSLTQLDKRERERLEYDSTISPGMPWVVAVDPENFLVPFGTVHLHDCEWVDHIIVRNLDDLKKDVKYEHTKDLDGTHLELSMKMRSKERFYTELQRNAKWVEFHEIRDAKERSLVAVLMNPDRIIRYVAPDELQIDGFPYVDVSFNDDPEYYWSIPDAAVLEPQQLEMNEARTQAMKHRRIALLKFLIREESMDEEQLDRMLSENCGAAAFTKGAPKEVVDILQPHIPPDLVSWVDVIRQDVRELIGMGRQELGEADKGSRMTATHSQIVHMAKELRMDERRDLMADSLSHIMRKVLQVVAKFWDDSHIVQVIGYDGARYWVRYDEQSLRGEYDVKVDVESMTPQTKALRRQELLQLIQALAGNPRVGLDYMLKELLRGFDWLDVSKVLPEAPENAAGPMPMAQYQGMQQRMLQEPSFRQARVAQTVGAMGGMEGA